MEDQVLCLLGFLLKGCCDRVQPTGYGVKMLLYLVGNVLYLVFDPVNSAQGHGIGEKAVKKEICKA